MGEVRPLTQAPIWKWAGRVRSPLGFSYTGRADVGRWGEWLALKHLRRMKWDVLARNWTSRRGEIDLVAYDSTELVFVEVRTRLGDQRPEESIGETKIGKLEKLAWEFVRCHDLAGELYRLDLIAVETPDLRRFELRHYHL